MHAKKLIKEAAERASSNGSWDSDLFKAMAHRKISVALVRGTGMILRAYADTLFRGIGQDFLLGDHNPTFDSHC